MAFCDLTNISCCFLDDYTSDSSCMTSEEDELEYSRMDITRQINLRSKIVKVKGGTTKKFIMAEEHQHKMTPKRSTALFNREYSDSESSLSDQVEDESQMNLTEPVDQSTGPDQTENELVQVIENGSICDEMNGGPSKEIESTTTAIENSGPLNEIELPTAAIGNDSVHSERESDDRENGQIQPQQIDVTPVFHRRKFTNVGFDFTNEIGQTVVECDPKKPVPNEIVHAQANESGKF